MSSIFGMDMLNSIKNKYDNQVNKKNETEKTKKTIGNPELSEAASNYYEELKAKYGDAEFVLVSEDQKENATEIASRIQTDKSMVVVISEDEVEKMANDETVRAQNEQLIADAQTQFPEMQKQLAETGVDVKSFGMQINGDGTASYFAVVDKSIAAQKERIEANLEEKRAEKKADAKEAAAERLEGKHTGHKEDLTTVSASSMEDLISKIKDVMYEAKTDSVMTKQEKLVGQNFDFSL